MAASVLGMYIPESAPVFCHQLRFLMQKGTIISTLPLAVHLKRAYSFFFGAEQATFSRSLYMSFGLEAESSDITVVDFDGNSADDIIIASFGIDAIDVFYGNEPDRSTFGKAHSTGYGSKPYMFAKAYSHDKRISSHWPSFYEAPKR